MHSMDTIELKADEQYNINLSGANIVYITNLLAEKPYKEVSGVIQIIANQINQPKADK